MILLFLALVCLGSAVFIVAQLITQPAQERLRFRRRVASYGQQLQRIATAEESARTRLLAPMAERLARLVLRVNPKTTIEGVSYKLVSAGLSRRISPTTFLALKAAAPVGLGMIGVALGASSSPLLAVLFGGALGALGFIGPDFFINSKIKSRQESIRAQLP